MIRRFDVFMQLLILWSAGIAWKAALHGKAPRSLPSGARHAAERFQDTHAFDLACRQLSMIRKSRLVILSEAKDLFQDDVGFILLQ
jgi:hypothetical protein